MSTSKLTMYSAFLRASSHHVGYVVAAYGMNLGFVPEISRFFGIVIQMYFDDHPPPHFHARYGTMTARVSLAPVATLESGLPPRALRLTLEWAILHEQELLENWRRIRAGQTPARIAPLE